MSTCIAYIRVSICIFCFYVLYTHILYIFILIYKQGFWFNGYKEKLFSSQTAEDKTEQRNCFAFLDEAQYNVIPRAKFPHELGWSPDSFQDTYFKNFICEHRTNVTEYQHHRLICVCAFPFKWSWGAATERPSWITRYSCCQYDPFIMYEITLRWCVTATSTSFTDSFPDVNNVFADTRVTFKDLVYTIW